MPRVKGNGGSYGMDKVEEGLVCYAKTRNFAAVERETGLKGQTVATWVHKYHVDRWEEIRAKWDQEARADILGAHKSLALLNMAKEYEALEGTDVSEIHPRDRAKAAQSFATAAGIHTSRANEMENPDQHLTIKMDSSEILQSLFRRTSTGTVDSTAEEVVEG